MAGSHVKKFTVQKGADHHAFPKTTDLQGPDYQWRNLPEWRNLPFRTEGKDPDLKQQSRYKNDYNVRDGRVNINLIELCGLPIKQHEEQIQEQQALMTHRAQLMMKQHRMFLSKQVDLLQEQRRLELATLEQRLEDQLRTMRAKYQRWKITQQETTLLKEKEATNQAEALAMMHQQREELLGAKEDTAVQHHQQMQQCAEQSHDLKHQQAAMEEQLALVSMTLHGQEADVGRQAKQKKAEVHNLDTMVTKYEKKMKKLEKECRTIEEQTEEAKRILKELQEKRLNEDDKDFLKSCLAQLEGLLDSWTKSATGDEEMRREVAGAEQKLSTQKSTILECEKKVRKFLRMSVDLELDFEQQIMCPSCKSVFDEDHPAMTLKLCGHSMCNLCITEAEEAHNTHCSVCQTFFNPDEVAENRLVEAIIGRASYAAATTGGANQLAQNEKLRPVGSELANTSTSVLAQPAHSADRRASRRASANTRGPISSSRKASRRCSRSQSIIAAALPGLPEGASGAHLEKALRDRFGEQPEPEVVHTSTSRKPSSVHRRSIRLPMYHPQDSELGRRPLKAPSELANTVP